MGSMVLYIIEWAFALLVLMAIYKAAFSGTTLHRFNRFYLLGATLLSALLPLMKVTVTEGTSVAAGLSIEETDFARELSGTLTFAGEPGIIQADETETAQTPQSGKRTSLWAVMLIGTYTIYVLTLIIGWSRSIVRTCKFLHGKPRRRLSRTVWLVTHSEPYGPFSWMNYIVISDSEKGFARHASLRHEYSHVKLFHSIDLVVLLVCTIVNPVCWLVLQEIKIVHEYEADDEVINRYGIQEEDYQRLLILRTVGAEAYALASSFNLNIKKRIIMMNKYKTRKRRLIWLLLLVPMLGMTSVLFARTEKAVNQDDKLRFSSTDVELSYGLPAPANPEQTNTNGVNKDLRIRVKGDSASLYVSTALFDIDNGQDRFRSETTPKQIRVEDLDDYIDQAISDGVRIRKVHFAIQPDVPMGIFIDIKQKVRNRMLLNVVYEKYAEFGD